MITDQTTIRMRSRAKYKGKILPQFPAWLQIKTESGHERPASYSDLLSGLLSDEFLSGSHNDGDTKYHQQNGDYKLQTFNHEHTGSG